MCIQDVCANILQIKILRRIIILEKTVSFVHCTERSTVLQSAVTCLSCTMTNSLIFSKQTAKIYPSYSHFNSALLKSTIHKLYGVIIEAP